MRIAHFLVSLLAVAACGDDGGHDVSPTLVPGGGVRDPGIDGELNVYVIDGDTDQPIAGARVRVGAAEGVTDADGLYVLSGDVKGPVTAAVAATGYVPSVWVGLDSANLTVPLERTSTSMPAPPQAELAGSITGWESLPAPATNHILAALVSYSQSREIGANDNDLPPPVVSGPIAANVCARAPTATPPCAWRINSRIGRVQPFAVIIDIDGRGTPAQEDDIATIVNFAVGTPVDVVDGVDQTGLALTILPAGSTTTAQVGFGTPPAGLTQTFGLVGVDVGDAGVLRLGQVSAAMTSVVVPSLSAIPGSTYEFLAVSGEDPAAGPPAQSIVLRRGLSSASAISAGAWLPPPTGLASDRAQVSFSGVGEATVHTIEIDTTGATPSRAMSVAILDDTATIDLPTDFAPLPGGALDVRVLAIEMSADFDPREFSVDDFDDIVQRIASDTLRLN